MAQSTFVLTPSASKPAAPFKITKKNDKFFKIRTMTINFNTAGFVKDAGCNEFDYLRRVGLLAKFMRIMSKNYHVQLFNLQEMTSRYMNLESIRRAIMTELLQVHPAWTATNPFGRHGDGEKSLHLMTFYNANVFHLNGVINCHFSKGEARSVGDNLCPEEAIGATSNAILMDMSLTVPDQDEEYHLGGVSVDNDLKFMNVNLHMPLKGCYRMASLTKLLNTLESYPNINDYYVSVSGDFNSFGDDPTFDEIIELMKKIGKPSALGKRTGDNTTYSYQTLTRPQFRNTTFVGMLYDLKNNMKMDITPENYKTWVNGDADEILEKLNRKVQPLDWHLSRDTNWCMTLMTNVVDTTDLRNLDFMIPTIDENADVSLLPDLGNYITDHLPLMTTLYVVRM